MSWNFLQGQEEASWDPCSLDTPPSALWSLIPIAVGSSLLDNGTDCSRGSRSGTTSRPSTGDHGADQWTLSQAASRAPGSALQARAKDSRTSSLACGGTWLGSLVRSGRGSYGLKTPPTLFGEGSIVSSSILPRWGSMRGGELWEHGKPAHRISGIGSGCTLPTPTAAQYGRNKSGTPGASVRLSLHSMAARNQWPTPAANEHKAGTPDGKMQWMLTHAAKSGCGTRRAYLAQRTGPPVRGGRLNPLWVAWLMGWPIGWTEFAPLGTDKFRQWLRAHGVR